MSNEDKSESSEVAKQTARFYDAEAVTYDRKRWGSPAGARLDRFQRGLVLSMLSPVGGLEILEVGTGTGRFAVALAEEGARVTGLDISPGMLAEARRRCAHAALHIPPQFMLGNVDSLPFPDGHFDSALCINVIQMFPSVENALREIGRVVKPGGHFMFNFPNLVSPYMFGGLLVNWAGSATGRNKAGRRKSRWFTLGEIRAKLDRFSFAIEDIRGQPLSPGNQLFSLFRGGVAHPKFLCPSLFVSTRRIV